MKNSKRKTAQSNDYIIPESDWGKWIDAPDGLRGGGYGWPLTKFVKVIGVNEEAHGLLFLRVTLIDDEDSIMEENWDGDCYELCVDYFDDEFGAYSEQDGALFTLNRGGTFMDSFAGWDDEKVKWSWPREFHTASEAMLCADNSSVMSEAFDSLDIPTENLVRVASRRKKAQSHIGSRNNAKMAMKNSKRKTAQSDVQMVHVEFVHDEPPVGNNTQFYSCSLDVEPFNDDEKELYVWQVQIGDAEYADHSSPYDDNGMSYGYPENAAYTCGRWEAMFVTVDNEYAIGLWGMRDKSMVLDIDGWARKYTFDSYEEATNAAIDQLNNTDYIKYIGEEIGHDVKVTLGPVASDDIDNATWNSMVWGSRRKVAYEENVGEIFTYDGSMLCDDAVCSLLSVWRNNDPDDGYMGELPLYVIRSCGNDELVGKYVVLDLNDMMSDELFDTEEDAEAFLAGIGMHEWKHVASRN